MANQKLVTRGPSHLARVLAHLKAEPQLPLPKLKSLKLTLAYRNDHFGARHFVAEQLPRIRYANPHLDIDVEKVKKIEKEEWRPEMELTFMDGEQKTQDIHEKWSTTILKELMDLAGDEPWETWKEQAIATGIPVVPGEENENRIMTRTETPLPPFKDFRASASPADVSLEKETLKSGVAASLP